MKNAPGDGGHRGRGNAAADACRRSKQWLVLLAAWTLGAAGPQAATTISPDHAHAWGANIGWLNWRGDEANGAQLNGYFCSGYVFSPNVGWIHLGRGPADGRAYQNNSATDFGVNIDARGNLRGLAYGANIGWVRFEDQGAPKVDLRSGNLSGFVYGANVGWINLSNAVAFVRTAPGELSRDSDQDGLPDDWELQFATDLAVLSASGDADGDGYLDSQEYLADTDPLDASDNLRISAYRLPPTGGTVSLTWTTKPTRRYLPQAGSALGAGGTWIDLTPGPIAPDAGATTTRTFNDAPGARRFYRVLATPPEN